MSTKCQIGFYESPHQVLEMPSVVIYKHCDGYPEFMEERLLDFASNFSQQHSLRDYEYASAQCLIFLASEDSDGFHGYGICDNRLTLHFDIRYYYRIDEHALYTYKAFGERQFHELELVDRYPII